MPVIDCQQETGHLASLGAAPIPQGYEMPPGYGLPGGLSPGGDYVIRGY